jgi:hypothetical protein
MFGRQHPVGDQRATSIVAEGVVDQRMKFALHGHDTILTIGCDVRAGATPATS